MVDFIPGGFLAPSLWAAGWLWGLWVSGALGSPKVWGTPPLGMWQMFWSQPVLGSDPSLVFHELCVTVAKPRRSPEPHLCEGEGAVWSCLGPTQVTVLTTSLGAASCAPAKWHLAELVLYEEACLKRSGTAGLWILGNVFLWWQRGRVPPSLCLPVSWAGWREQVPWEGRGRGSWGLAPHGGQKTLGDLTSQLVCC